MEASSGTTVDLTNLPTRSTAYSPSPLRDLTIGSDPPRRSAPAAPHLPPRLVQTFTKNLSTRPGWYPLPKNGSSIITSPLIWGMSEWGAEMGPLRGGGTYPSLVKKPYAN